jgi:hypothetical protein
MPMLIFRLSSLTVVHHIPKETGAFISPAQFVADNVQIEKEVLDDVHANPLTRISFAYEVWLSEWSVAYI